MEEAQTMSVQEHALQAEFRKGPIPREITILVIASEWETEVREMDANLMRTPRLELRLK
jgi:hypothetical protein